MFASLLLSSGAWAFGAKDVEGSADTLMMLVDRPEVRAVAEFLATPEGIQNWIRAGSAISANSKTPADWYAGAYKLKVAADIARVRLLYDNILRERYDRVEPRLADLDQLQTIAAGYPDRATFLSALALEPPSRNFDH